MTNFLVMPHSLGFRIKMWKGALGIFLSGPSYFVVFNRRFTSPRPTEIFGDRHVSSNCIVISLELAVAFVLSWFTDKAGEAQRG